MKGIITYFCFLIVVIAVIVLWLLPEISGIIHRLAELKF